MKISLAQTYRQVMARVIGAKDPLPDVDHLVQLAGGGIPDQQREALLVQMSMSPLQSDLLRFTAALGPHSQNLAEELATLNAGNPITLPATPLPVIGIRSAWGRARRSTTAKRALIAGALAASVLLSALPWLPRHATAPKTYIPYATRTVPDQIFAWSTDRINGNQPTTQKPVQDQIFRSTLQEG